MRGTRITPQNAASIWGKINKAISEKELLTRRKIFSRSMKKVNRCLRSPLFENIYDEKGTKIMGIKSLFAPVALLKIKAQDKAEGLRWYDNEIIKFGDNPFPISVRFGDKISIKPHGIFIEQRRENYFDTEPRCIIAIQWQN